MRVCPKCGYRDLEYWRQNRWRTNVDFTKPSEFQGNYPQLSRDLEELANKIGIKKAVVTDKFYAYRYGSKRRVVERVVLTEFEVAGIQAFHIPRERIDLEREDIFQQKLAVKPTQE